VAQVLVTILTNAFEALEQEQGEINFSISEVEITQRRECLHGHLVPGRYAKVTVSDNGLGISKDRIDKIFDPFYTSKELGNGMGLSIARGIVMAHNGGIDLISVPFKGTAISIYLPAHAANTSIAPQPRSTPKLTRSTILLIDDQADLLETVGMMLDVLGHDCIQCSDPRQAMEIIGGTESKFDLVITDYSMPNVTGLDIANLCAQKRPSVPVIVATGYNDSTTLSSSVDGGEYKVLNKPFGFNELKAMLNSVLISETS
jgi:CheY-like chemotaxis protein